MAEETKQQQQAHAPFTALAHTPDAELVMAHVLFLDIVGYSKLLPMERQLRALKQLQQFVLNTHEFAQAEHKGQLLCLPTGDGMALVFFTPTPLAPVQCALELGQALRAQPEFALRMGVHSGPVYPHQDIRANKNVVGGGINIAQRVMDCGDTGHILLSEPVAGVLKQIYGWVDSLHDLGEIEVKHGLRVHIFNLCTANAGNDGLPQKCIITRRRARRRTLLVVIVSVLLAAIGFTTLWPRHQTADRRSSPDKPAPVWAYQRTLVGHLDTVYSVAFSADGRTVAGGSYDHTIILWDAQTGTSRRTLTASANSLVYTVATSPTGDVVAAGVGRDVQLWDSKTEGPPQSLKGHTGFVFGLAFALDGRTLASASADHTICIWDVQTKQLLQTLAAHTDEVNTIAFSADGKLLASGSYDKTIIIWDVPSWTVKMRLTGHGGSVYSVAFAPDSQTLASGSDDGTVRLWDVKSSRLKQTLYQHQGAVNSVAFAPDGRTLASAGVDGALFLWDARTGTVQQLLHQHKASVTSVVFAPDGRLLASGSKDKTVLLWGLQANGVATGMSRLDAP